MLFLSRAKITIRRNARGQRVVRVEGEWKRYAARIIQAVEDLDIPPGTVRYRNGRHLLSGNYGSGLQQRILNFLVNECPLKR